LIVKWKIEVTDVYELAFLGNYLVRSI